MSIAETDLDRHADRLNDRREALDLYLNAAFDNVAKANGYQAGGVASGDHPTGDVIRFFVVRTDETHILRAFDRDMIERKVAEARIPGATRDGLQAGDPRWSDEKRAAKGISEYALTRFPPAS